MSNSSDRSHRAGWQQFTLYSILIMVFIGIVTNLATIFLIAFADKSVYLPITILIVLVNLLVAAGAADGISDWESIKKDYDEEERKTHLAQRFDATNTVFFKILISLIFGGVALAQLYVMYLA